MSDGIEPLCRLEVTDRAFLPVAGGVAGDAGTVLGLGLEDASRLRTVTHELCAAVAAEGFPGDGPVSIQIAVERRPGSVAVVVTDQGEPSHLTRPGNQPPRLTELMQLGFADELTFAGEGRKGNRAELRKRLRYVNVRQELDEAPAEPPVEVADDVAEHIVYRALRDDETLEVARLFHRVYGLTAYSIEVVYEPDRLAELVRAGIHLGTVAEVDGRLIGHVASRIDRPDAKVALVGELAVDPAYRHLKIGGMLAAHHAARCVERGLVGVYSQAVTVHPASQKLLLRFGGHEVGLWLAAQQPTIEFKGIDDQTTGRRSVVLFYNGIGKEPQRTVHPPAQYREMAELLYANAVLPRTVGEATLREPADLPAESALDLSLRSEARIATITVVAYGRDFVEALQSQLRQLCVHRFELVAVHLPLADPLTSLYGGGLHELGFFFAGILPEYLPSGDALMLQYLNDIDVSADDILTASPFGERLKELVMADHVRTQRQEAERQRSRARLSRIFESLS